MLGFSEEFEDFLNYFLKDFETFVKIKRLLKDVSEK
jgi:hypothetical protein